MIVSLGHEEKCDKEFDLHFGSKEKQLQDFQQKVMF